MAESESLVSVVQFF